MPNESDVIDVTVVVVNYRTPQLVIQCLDSLSAQQSDGIRCKVLVVDNNSGDSSVEILSAGIIKNGWAQWVSVMPLARNGGFAYGNNKALEKILSDPVVPEFIWLLNPDTTVKKDACHPLVKFLQENKEVGIAGSRLEDPDGTAQVSAFRDSSVMGELLNALRLGVFDRIFIRWLVAPAEIPSGSTKVDWVAGASMMMKSEMFRQVGLFDEEYFLYFEEVDFIVRAREKGWTCWYVPESRVVHLVGGASGISDTRKKAPRRPSYWFDSRRRFFLKHLGIWQLILADSLWMLGYSLWRFRRLIQRKPDSDPPYFLGDFFRHSIFRRGWRL
jgi:GT2 family glycosyltransferase